MGRNDTHELMKMLKPFNENVVDLVLWLRDFAWKQCAGANELIYDNYNAVAIGWSPTEKLSHTICSVAVYRSGKKIHFGFYHGNELHDTDKLLIGNGNQYRYVQVESKIGFPKEGIKKLITQAYANALSKVEDPKQLTKGKTIVKSVSTNKRTVGVKKV